jgi:hypothetical protein
VSLWQQLPRLGHDLLVGSLRGASGRPGMRSLCWQRHNGDCGPTARAALRRL